MSKIRVYQKHYSYSYEGGYTGDETITSRTADTYVEVLNITKCFERDEYMHKAREWVNKTFAQEEYEGIQDNIRQYEKQIADAQEEIARNKRKLLTFLVDVDTPTKG